MSTYSSFERIIARKLDCFPVVKRFAKCAYSRLVYLTAGKTSKYKAVREIIAIGKGQKCVFFGYYDKCPENHEGWVLAQCSLCSSKKAPSALKNVALTVFDEQQRPVLEVPVIAYNWQQGCRAHWLNDELFIFNDFDSSHNRYSAQVYSIYTGRPVKVFQRPVQDSFGVEYFISLNYRRLMSLRPDYGYRNLPALGPDELNDLGSDGLWRVEYDSGTSRLLISLADACAVESPPDFASATHKFNHVMISPNGKQFIFIHRYFFDKRRFDRLLLADAETGKLQLISDYGMISHCCWADDKTVLGYLRGPNGKDGYWLIDVNSGDFQAFQHEKLDAYGDGHPHVHGDWIITDTYPDKARLQHLLLCNWKTGEVAEVGKFFHGFQFSGEARCDLHPRFSRDGKFVYFDSVFTGQRQFYRMELPS